MPRYRRYRLAKLDISALGERPAAWTFTRDPVSGTEYTYRVVDTNFSTRNGWEFLVRVPKGPDDRIEVRPRAAPNLKAWVGLERRSITLTRARRAGYRGWYYCQVSLADPTSERTKDVVHGPERDSLPSWFDDLRSRIRLKKTVRATKAHDGDQLVVIARPDEHDVMIGVFFATKVWVLKERVSLLA